MIQIADSVSPLSRPLLLRHAVSRRRPQPPSTNDKGRGRHPGLETRLESGRARHTDPFERLVASQRAAMTHLLPPNLLRLFAPRPPVIFEKPLDRNPDRVTDKESQFTGVARLFAQIKEENAAVESVRQAETKPNGIDSMQGVEGLVKTEPDAEAKPTKRGKLKRQPLPPKAKKVAPTQRSKHKKPKVHGPKPVPAPTKLEEKAATEGWQPTEQLKVLARAEERHQRKEAREKRVKQDFDPAKDPNATGDPYKTLFIARLDKTTTEDDLRKEFDMYGRIEKLTLVRNITNGKSKRYAFILYEREKDMKAAYKDADGLKIKGQRILVDVERGRTVKEWKPMRLGGGLGGQPKPVQPETVQRFGAPIRGRGGFRGGGFGDRGGGGGFRGGGGGRGFGPPRGGAFAPRGGGFESRGPPGGAFGMPPDQGYGGGPPGGGFQQGGPPRGQGVGFNQGPPTNAFGMPQGGAFGHKRDYDQGPPHGYGGGGGGGGYDDRDSKRPRY